MLLAAHLFLVWALFAFIVVLEHGGLLYLASRSGVLGVCAAAVTVVAARFQARAWRDESALGTAVLVSVGAAATVFAAAFLLTFARWI